MSDDEDGASAPRRLDENVAAQARRKLRAQQRDGRDTLWVGFASFGLIGWSVAVPTLIGVAVGVWLDRHHPGRFSWTLMLLAIGIVAGCANAWHWVSREHRVIREDDPEQHDGH